MNIVTNKYAFFTRDILITLIMTLLIDDKRKFRYYLWTIAIFIGLIAAESGIKGMIKGEIGGVIKYIKPKDTVLYYFQFFLF